ncbi:hypothetical protein KY345_00900, partial [Candidatus Woesearchaeota archaeon]|nr:hypothetical protein [Candidatus Woesearchaeota archaeon]
PGEDSFVTGIMITGTYNFLRYYIENQAGQVVQEGKEIKINEIQNNIPRFDIDGSNIQSPGIYYLKIQVGNQIAGQAFKPQLEEIRLDVGDKEMLLKPMNFRAEVIKDEPNLATVKLSWDKIGSVEYTVTGDFLYKTGTDIYSAEEVVLKTDDPQTKTYKLVAKLGTLTKEETAEVTIPGKTAEQPD